MPLKLQSAGGGSVTINATSTASTYTLTAPAINGTIITTADSGSVSQSMLAAGIAGNGPSFAAYNSVAISIPNTGFTKMALQSEEWDTANCFDTTNSRFTPNVAGYYQISGNIQLLGVTYLIASIWKNGSESRRGLYSYPSNVYSAPVSGLIYLNGSTDYIELWAYNGGTSYNSQIGAAYTYMTGFLARAA